MRSTILRYFATKCKVLARKGSLLTFSDTANTTRIHESVLYKSLSRNVQGYALCTSLQQNNTKFIDLTSSHERLIAGEEITIDPIKLYVPPQTGEIVSPISTNPLGRYLGHSIKQKLREKKKGAPRQLITKYIAIDMNQPIMKGEFIVLLGPTNRGKSKIAQSAILSHIQFPNHYAIYCSSSIGNCEFLKAQSPLVKDRCSIIYSDLTKSESLISYFSALKLAEEWSFNNRNILLVFDDTVEQLVFERSCMIPNDMLVHY